MAETLTLDSSPNGIAGETHADMPEEKQRKILEKVLGFFYWADREREQYVDRWYRYYKLYRNVPVEKAEDWRSNLFVPLTMKTVETILPRIIGSIFASDPFFSVIPRRMEQAEVAKEAQKVMAYQIQEAKIVEKAIRCFRDLLIYGKTHVDYHWKITTKKIRQNVPAIEDGQAVFKKEYVDKPVFEGPDWDNISIFDFWPEPGVPELAKMSGYIYRKIISVNDLKDLADNPDFVNIEEAAKTNPPENLNQVLNEKLEAINLEVNQADIHSKQMPHKRMEILIYHGRMDLDEDDYAEEVFIAVCNRKTVIQAIPNPYDEQFRTIVDFDYIRLEDEYYGMGVPELGESLQFEANEIRNMRLDNVYVTLNRIFKLKRSSQLIDEAGNLNVEFFPGACIPVVESDDIEPLDFAPVPAQSYTEGDIISGDFDGVQGVYDYTRGAGPKKSNETATGIQSIIAEANARFQLIITTIHQSLQTILMHHAKMNEQFLPETFDIGIGTDYNTITQMTRPQIVGDFKYTISMNPTFGNTQVRLQQLLSLVAALATSPMLQLINWQEYLRQILEAAQLQPIEKLMIPPPMAIDQQGIPAVAGQTGAAPPGTQPGEAPPIGPDILQQLIAQNEPQPEQGNADLNGLLGALEGVLGGPAIPFGG